MHERAVNFRCCHPCVRLLLMFSSIVAGIESILFAFVSLFLLVWLWCGNDYRKRTNGLHSFAGKKFWKKRDLENMSDQGETYERDWHDDLDKSASVGGIDGDRHGSLRGICWENLADGAVHSTYFTARNMFDF